MTSDQLKTVMQQWQLNAAQMAKVLCLHSSKMSEYLGDVERIPCAIAFSIEALQRLPDSERRQLFEQRLARKPHGKA